MSYLDRNGHGQQQRHHRNLWFAPQVNPFFAGAVAVSMFARTRAAFNAFFGFTSVLVPAVAAPDPASASAHLPASLEQHVRAIASVEHNTASPAALERSARYIESRLAGFGYQVRRQEYKYDGHAVRNIEVSLVNTNGIKEPSRIIIVGAHYDSARGAPGANDNGSGAAALLELARMLKPTRLREGSELKFVFFVNEEPPYFLGDGMGSRRHAQDLRQRRQPVEAAIILETIGYYTHAANSQRYPPGLEKIYPSTGNFIAFVGTTQSSDLVRNTLGAFRASSDFPAHGLAAPASVAGVTLSDHTSYNRMGYPALMVTDTAFMRYPYYHTAQDTPDKLDYSSLARVVQGLEKVVAGMVAPQAKD
ncbi:MAG: M28 family peptidase [Pseudomonadota bacterium]